MGKKKTNKLTAILSMLIAAVLVFSPSISASAADGEELQALILGDVNGDNNVNLLDAIEIQKFALSISEFDNNQQTCADVDNNGEVKLIDSIYIQKHSLDMEVGITGIGSPIEVPTEPDTEPTEPDTNPSEIQTDPTEPTTPQETETETETETASETNPHDTTEPSTAPSEDETEPTEADTVELNKATITLGIGETYTLSKSSPTGTDLTDALYHSDNPEIASVEPLSGKISATAVGIATVTITTRNGATASCVVTVKNAPTAMSLNKYSLTLGIGETFDLNSSLPEGEGAYSILYSSNNPEVASVKAAGGLVIAKSVGGATITATAYNGVKVYCNIAVKKAPTSMSLNKSSLTLCIGDSFDLNSSLPKGEGAYSILYSSADSSIAEVRAAGGIVTANSIGTVSVTATAYNGVKATCVVTVKPAPTAVKLSDSSISLHNSQESTISFSIGNGSYSCSAEWSSSKPDVATVEKTSDNKAKITAKGKGDAVITVTLYNGISAKCTVKVNAIKIYLSPSNQDTNPYIYGNTNEMVQCNIIANYAAEALIRNGFDVKKAPEGQKMATSIDESNNWGADMHIPIHTNGFVGVNMGTVVMVKKAEGEPLKAAQAMLNAVGPITPGDDFAIMERPDLRELNSINAISVYVEVEFHDTVAGAKWIINNTKPAGEAIAKGVCDYYNINFH